MNPPTQTGLRSDLDSQPLYNIKAVVEATGLPAATLRAWERRYGALAPGRTDSGYRLYSARDIALLRWLKERVAEGLSISQAIALMEHRRNAQPLIDRRGEPWQGFGGVRDALLAALLAFDEVQADHVLEEAFAVYGLEAVAEHVVAPSMARVGELWHQGKASTAAEHFVSSYLRRKLDSIINAAPRSEGGSTIVLGCAPGEWHDLGLLLLHMLLRRRGVNSLYLGQNVPQEQFAEEMERMRPAVIVIAATMAEAVPGLIGLGRAVAGLRYGPQFTYGGRAFIAHPDLRREVPGIFLGESLRSAVEYLVALAHETEAQAGNGALRSGLRPVPR